MNRLVLLACLFALCYGAAVPERKQKLHRPGKVVGGTKIDIEKAPWVLGYEILTKQAYQAVIINEKWAATAAHIMDDLAFEVVLRAGSSTIEKGGTVHKVIRTIVHEKYNSEDIHYDVAVVEVEEPFEFGPGIQAVTLATTDPAPGDRLSVAGWGALDLDGTAYGEDLYSVDIPTIDRSQCDSLYEPYFNITGAILCAQEEGKGVCDFDDGAPLVQDGKLFGINLGTIECGSVDYPALFTNIADPSIRDFIEENTKIAK